MKTLSHYASKFNFMALITAHEHDAFDDSCQKLAMLLGISPGLITYKWHFEDEQAPCKT